MMRVYPMAYATGKVRSCLSTATLIMVLGLGCVGEAAETQPRDEPGAFVSDSSRIKHPAALHLPIGYGHRHGEEQVRKMQSLAQAAMTAAEQDVLALIEDKHGLPVAMPCPKCGGFALDFALAAPRALTCRECSAVVDSEAFPATGSVTGPNGLGKTVTYAYHQEGKRRYFVEPRIRYCRHHVLAEVCRAVAYQYHVTEDEKYAKQACDCCSLPSTRRTARAKSRSCARHSNKSSSNHLN